MSMATPSMVGVKAAVIGTGFIGTVHSEAVRRVGAELSGVLSSGRDSTAAAAKRLGTRPFGSLDELLSSDVDVVHVASPNALHSSHSLAALKAGKHVICEKPMAVGLEEAEDMQKAATESGLVAALCYNQRFYPQLHQAAELVATGGIGEPHLIHGRYLQDWLLLKTDWNWRLDPALAGPLRAVADIGSHWLDAAQFILGSPIVEVYAELHTLHMERLRPTAGGTTFSSASRGGANLVSVTSDDSASILLHFANGCRGSVLISQVAAGHKNLMDLEVDGTRASLQWNSQEPDVLVHGRRDHGNIVTLREPATLLPGAQAVTFYPGGHVEGFGETFRGLFERVYTDVVGGGPSPTPAYPTFADGRQALAIEAAISRSSASGRWAPVPVTTPELGVPHRAVPAQAGRK